MPDKTPRLDLDDYDVGDAPWDHSDLVSAVDEHAVARGPIADRPASGDYDDELFFATDQNVLWRWDADASDWIGVGGKGSESQPVPGTTHVEALNTDNINNAAVVMPDGSNDASKVQDAIDDRQNGEPVGIVDPGIKLDADQKITLPADEHGFSLFTWGQPEWEIPSGASFSTFIEKPSSTAVAFDLKSYHIGSMTVDDKDAVLTEALKVDDLKEAYIGHLRARNCRAVSAYGTNTTTANCFFDRPTIRNHTGAGIYLDGANAEANANMMFVPMYNSNSTGNGVAFEDHGEWNTWMHSRVEAAGTCHLFDGAVNYRVIEGNWDDLPGYNATIKERGAADGFAILQNRPDSFRKCAFSNGATKVIAGGRSNNPTIGVTDYLSRLRMATRADTVSNLGLFERSGSASLDSIWERMSLSLTTGATAGDQAILDMGGGSINVEAVSPKATVPIHFPAGQTADVVVRIEVHKDDSNRFGFVYDPNNHLGGHTTSNWYWEVEAGGIVQESTDTGTSPPDNSFNRLTFQHAGESTFAGYIDDTEISRTPSSGGDIGDAELRLLVETRTSESREIIVRTSRGASLLTI